MCHLCSDNDVYLNQIINVVCVKSLCDCKSMIMRIYIILIKGIGNIYVDVWHTVRSLCSVQNYDTNDANNIIVHTGIPSNFNAAPI